MLPLKAPSDLMFNLENRAKPILKWAGGKSGLLTRLIEFFPTHFSRYLEPFLGGGAVFLCVDGSAPCTINDSNVEIVEFYEVVRDRVEDLMGELDGLTARYCESFYYETRRSHPQNAIQRAARTLFLNKTGFNGLYRMNSRGEFNVPFGKRRKCPALYDRKNLLEIHRRLQNTEIANRDFEALVGNAKHGDFVYCDPPYEPLSRTSSFTAYTATGFGEKEQVRLRNACIAAAKRGAFVAISNSSSEKIRSLYSGFHIASIRAKRSINSKGHLRGEIDELVITTYPAQASVNGAKTH